MKMQFLYDSMFVVFLAWITLIGVAVASLTEPGPSNHASGSSVTCGNPTVANAEICRQIEELILKSTVRIRIQTWVVRPGESGYEFDSSTGHATLKAGRYLVTHNHLSVPLSIRPRAGEPEAYGGEVILFNSEGERRFRGPLSDFEVVWEDPETLVIAHKENGFFEKLGFDSAAFKEWSSLPLTVGMEVAQVDWDGTATRVDWTTVEEINLEERVPWLVLIDDITVGASGGGVFWQGTHIANNWLRLRTQDIEDSDTFADAATKVALNSAKVVGKFDQTPSLNGPLVGELEKTP